MGRSQVVLRLATPTDAPFLAELWASSLRRAEMERRLADVQAILERALASPQERLMIAEYDAVPAGAVLLQVCTVSALNLEPTVRVLSPSVAASLQRRGVGRALMEAALAFAEEQGVTTLATAIGSGARESNRFMARLGLSPLATYRVAPVVAVRARLRGRPGSLASVASGRQVTRVVAARRSMRRSRTAG